MIVNLLLVAGALIAVVMFVPRGGGSRDLGVSRPAAPAAQPTPDAEREQLLARLATLPTHELRELERTQLLIEASRLKPDVLRKVLRRRAS